MLVKALKQHCACVVYDHVAVRLDLYRNPKQNINMSVYIHGFIPV